MGAGMGGDVATLVAEMTPYISAAVGAYGGAVLAKARDEAADATVSLGRRLLQKIFGHKDEAAPLPEPLADLVADPRDGDALASCRLAIRKALSADPSLEAEIRSMLGSGEVTQQVHAGRDAYTAGRDQVVVNYRHPGE
jgi:dienelactone hydrolase